MKVTFKTLTLPKLYPLAISRGTTSTSDNLFVTVEHDGLCGIGELSPATSKSWSAAQGEAQLSAFCSSGFSLEPEETWAAMKLAEIDPPAMAALDVALWDLKAKMANLPLYRLLGLEKKSVPTSVTIGLNPPDVTRERVPDILQRTGAKCLKIKLGSPQGRAHDREHFLAAKEASEPFGSILRVDANGGWTLKEAIEMIAELKELGVDYVEQPLVEGNEAELIELHKLSALPVYIDESCRWANDVAKWADRVDGVNLKLMKCGGVTEALRIVEEARKHNLKTMIGCMSESSVAIAAGAAMGALFDHIDLDSHLNLNPDPASGAPIIDGVIVPLDTPGHGAMLNA